MNTVLRPASGLNSHNPGLRRLIATTLVAMVLLVMPVKGRAQNAVDVLVNDSGRKWSDVIAWTHAWDMIDIVSYDDDGSEWSLPAATRVDSVNDRGTGDLPLRRDAGAWSNILQTNKLIPGPLVVPESKRFNGRPAMLTDSVGPGGFGKVYSIVSPNADPKDESTWFNAPNGYSTPYWGAVLCRPANGSTDVFGAWDAYNGHLGTTATMAKGLTKSKDGPVWGMTTSLRKGDPWPSTRIVGSEDQTVLVIGKVHGATSFMEINWRDASGRLQSDRTDFTLASYSAKEIFFGYVHSSYVSAAGLRTGAPDESDIDKVRAWSADWLPPTGALPTEP